MVTVEGMLSSSALTARMGFAMQYPPSYFHAVPDLGPDSAMAEGLR